MLCLQTGLWLAGASGGARFDVRRLCGAALGFLVGRLLGVRRAHVLESLRRAGVAEPARVANAMYRGFGHSFFELCFTPASADTDGLEFDARLRERLLTAGGAVVACAHSGNWDLLACRVAAIRPLGVVTKQLKVSWINQLWQKIRSRRGVRLLMAGNVARPALEALVRGEWVAMMIDQAPERARAITRVPFLGQLAEVDLAPALMAQRAKVPLIVAFPYRLANGRLTAYLPEVIEPPRVPSRESAERAMRQATQALERFVLRVPEQWLWMHRRWKRSGGMGG